MKWTITDANIALIYTCITWEREWEAFNEDADYGDYDDEVEDDYEFLTPREKETNDRLDMGRNDAGEYMGYM